jgi:hypothetical protein
MIINKTNRFAFVHIPKCGGTSVRKVLDTFNEWSYLGNPWIGETKKLGTVHFSHLPLQALRILFPEDLELVLKYESFALVRDPYERFFSKSSVIKSEIGNPEVMDFIASYYKHDIELYKSICSRKGSNNSSTMELGVASPSNLSGNAK